MRSIEYLYQKRQKRKMQPAPFRLIRYIRIGIFFSVLLAGIFGIASQGICFQKLTIGWEPWEPYQYKDANQHLTGLDVELILAIASDAGYTISFEQIPWKRQLAYLKNGDISMATGASDTPERERYAYFSTPYRTESVRLYVRTGEAARYPFKRLEDIIDTPFQLGVSRGYYYGKVYEDLIKNPDFKGHVQEVTDDTFNYQKLMLKHIDGFFADPRSFASIIRRKGLVGKIEPLPMKIYSTNISIMFSKKGVSPETVQAFNESLIHIKKNGKYQRILKKYLDKQ